MSVFNKKQDPDLKTHYASPERSGPVDLEAEIKTATLSPLMNSVLRGVGGLLAILNKNRQIISLNEEFLHSLGVKKAAEIMGLRHGEAFNCVHAKKMQAGCGTSKFCSTCGATIAIVTCQAQERAVSQTCALKTTQGGKIRDIFFRVICSPIVLDDRKFILLFMQDITIQQKKESLERMFLHDINNTLNALMGTVEIGLFKTGEASRQESKRVHDLSLRLAREIKMQSRLAGQMRDAFEPMIRNILFKEVVDELHLVFSEHPAAKTRKLLLPFSLPQTPFLTDFTILMRVLTNMVLNALEASQENEKVRVTCDHHENLVSFSVWNQQLIPEEVALRIFQRNFSTKDEPGRGLGTYAMKIFGEEFLGGKIFFSSTQDEGTKFTFELPSQVRT